MADHTKISVDTETHKLVEQIADAESRTMAGQIRHWAKKDAKRLTLRVRTMVVPKIPKQPGIGDSDKININRVQKNAKRKNR